MPQTLISPDDIKDGSVTISGPEAHHLVRVLRVQPGQPLSLFDGRGNSYTARCKAVDASAPSVTATIVSISSTPVRSSSVYLFQGLPKGSKFDYVIEKAAELGTEGVIPFLSEKNVIKLTHAQGMSKLKRWHSLARAAAKQSGRSTLPMIEAARPLKEFEAHLKTGLTILLDTKEKSSTFKTLREKLAAQPKLINIVVGPESGFSEKERALLLSWGAVPVSLGLRTLRSETAGLVTLAILNHELEI